MRLPLACLLAWTSACGSNPPSPHDAGVDAFVPRDSGIDAASCAATGACTEGPTCGGVCCGQGEHCAAGVCMCGNVAACTGGDLCFPGGGFAATACGVVCCGTTMSCPI